MSPSDPTDRRAAAAPTARPRRRRGYLIGTACALAVALGVGGAAAFAATSQSEEPKPKAGPAHTAPIERGTLHGSKLVSGTLSFGPARAVGTATGGTVTEPPPVGTTVDTGGKLFVIDNKPVFLMTGATPAYRGFEAGMENGPDITGLEASLQKLGFLNREPGSKFASSTADAIKRWQKATDQEATGSIPFGTVVFAPGPLRIGEAKANIGDHVSAGSPVVTVTGVAKRVDVDLKLGDQRLATVGGKVQIELPSGQTVTGSVASVGGPVENEDKKIVVKVVITLDDSAASGELQQASVTVSFPTEKREDVLSVPVSALLALNGDTFGVELVNANGTTKRVPVKTGAFIDGRVEISGNAIAAGKKVVVPSI